MTDFRDFMKRREAAASAYCRGEGGDVDAMSTETAPATFFGPDGKAVNGPRTVKDVYAAGARQFGKDGKSNFEIVHSAEGGDIAYWSSIQRATVETKGKSMPMDLRVTELFRHEKGEWKLVHRHADVLKQD